MPKDLSVKKKLLRELEKRILILDGAMGSLLLKDGCMICPDFLVETNPKKIVDLHKAYLVAGADIITTNSFNSNSYSLERFGRGRDAYEISRLSAWIARRTVDDFMALNPDTTRFVAGSVGPVLKDLSRAHTPQIEGLIDGGVDIILIETAIHLSDILATLHDIEKISREKGREIPVMLSASVSKEDGRLLSGQSIEEMYESIRDFDLLSVGLNCSFGPEHLVAYLRRLASVAECRVSCHPNAGLPREGGKYRETPESFARKLKPLIDERIINIIGGCCGTTPAHIRALARLTGK